MINTQEIINACDKVEQRCVMIADTHHGSSWLFDKVMRFFTAEIASESITFPVVFNTPLLGIKGEATIHRDGTLTMNTLK